MIESKHDLRANMIAFDRPKLDRFKLIITKADEAKVETVMFDGNEYDVAYGKYLVEYLETKLPK
jgi:hypothetical protein